MNSCTHRSTRRLFLKSAATAAAAFTLPRFSIGQPGGSANGRLNIACIGIAHRGFYAVSECLQQANIVALCDVDAALVQSTYQKATEIGFPDLPKLPLFRDYREMFAKMADQIDAVTISTPDHHHFPAAMLAIQHGKHVFVEKPLCRTVREVRALRQAAKKRGVITQMGNQGHASEGIRLVKEWTQAGVLGDVREVIAWAPPFSHRYFTRPASLPLEPEPAPETLAWDLWLGPAESRPYSRLYAPHKWRGWWDFGSGMLGDWACHTLDTPFWSLELGAPISVEAETNPMSRQIAPEWAAVTYKFAARGKMPAVTLKWFEGTQAKPPAPAGWDSNVEFPDRGMLMVGSKNTLITSGRPDSPQLVPRAVMEEFKKNRPQTSIPRVKGGPVKEWLDAIKGSGPLPGSNFEYSGALSEMVLLGAAAMRTGKRLEWDDQNARITNDPKLNDIIKISAREGWRI